MAGDGNGSALRHALGVAIILDGCNVHHGGQQLDRSSAVVILQADGSVIVRVGLTDMGQGNLTAAQIIAAQALGVTPEVVQVWQPDTTTVANSGPTVASRGAHASGMAILDAARRLHQRLDPLAAELLGCAVGDVRLGGGYAWAAARPAARLPISRIAAELAARRLEGIATGWYRSRPRRFDVATGRGAPYEFYSVACHVARVQVDAELGLVWVRAVTAAHDVGRVIHRDALEGQIEGCVAQGMGWGVTEELKLDRGRLANPNFTDYLIPTAADAPEVHIELLESEGAAGPFGAKGIGEPSFIPSAAAVRNAVVRALGVEIDRLPLSLPTIFDALGPRHPWAHLLFLTPRRRSNTCRRSLFTTGGHATREKAYPGIALQGGEGSSREGADRNDVPSAAGRLWQLAGPTQVMKLVWAGNSQRRTGLTVVDHPLVARCFAVMDHFASAVTSIWRGGETWRLHWRCGGR